MAELWFIGLGLHDERDLSRRALAVLTTCGAVFAEEYTAVLGTGSLERLSVELGRPVTLLGRAELEDGGPVLDALGPNERVALLVVGDPFAATTHVALRLEAESRGHHWRYLPNATILAAAAGYLGLMHYRFGRTVSLPFPEPGFAPTSPIEMVERNRADHLHSLVLLDLRPKEERFLRAHEALGILRERDSSQAVFRSDLPVAVVARVGSDTAAAWYGPLGQMARRDFGAPMHAIVVPSDDLHFEERTALERFALPHE